MFYSKAIVDELTAKILVSPNRYFKQNPASLLSFSLSEIGTLMMAMGDRGFANGNEVRDRIGMDPEDDLEEYTALENYVPVKMLGMQNKLGGGETDGK